MANEKRLIDANEAYEIARLHHKDFAKSIADLTSLREVLEDAPTVDAVEVVHGYWERFKHPSGTHGIRCSRCKVVNGRKSSFCPECGADMRGAEDG